MWDSVVSLADCRRVVAAINSAPAVVGEVLRRGQDAVDLRLRNCAEYILAEADARPVVAGLRSVARAALPLAGGPLDGVFLDGPKFCGYGTGEYFRAHRDGSDDPDDPRIVRRRSLSLICFLNAPEPAADLPSFDGGTVVMYVPGSNGAIQPVNIKPTVGTVVTFPSDLLHEVRPVRQGVRYSAVAWLYSRDGNEAE